MGSVFLLNAVTFIWLRCGRGVLGADRLSGRKDGSIGDSVSVSSSPSKAIMSSSLRCISPSLLSLSRPSISAERKSFKKLAFVLAGMKASGNPVAWPLVEAYSPDVRPESMRSTLPLDTCWAMCGLGLPDACEESVSPKTASAKLTPGLAGAEGPNRRAKTPPSR